MKLNKNKTIFLKKSRLIEEGLTLHVMKPENLTVILNDILKRNGAESNEFGLHKTQ
jgi:hypothetical protein